MTLACSIKLEMFIIDDPSLGLKPWLASSITTVSDAPNCSVTYNCHYDRNSFIIQATELTRVVGKVPVNLVFLKVTVAQSLCMNLVEIIDQILQNKVRACSFTFD